MAAALEFTGERYMPGTPGMIAYEHEHRYAFALRYARGRRVLDAACGEGYGTARLAGVARCAVGIDISEEAIAHARATYAQVPNLRYETGAVTALPLDDRSIDVIVSFETIEHLPAQQQPAMVAEFARVLASDGVLVLSSPNRRRYSEERNYRNPFHLHELDRGELERLLDPLFPARRCLHQVPLLASAVWVENAAGEAEAWVGDGDTLAPAEAPDGIYYLILAAKEAAHLPRTLPALSLYWDRPQTEWMRAEHAHAEVIRLDELLRRRDAALDAQTLHIRHLEELVAYRDRLVEERDAELAACRAAHGAEASAAAGLRQQVIDVGVRLERSESAMHESLQEQSRLQRALAAQDRLIEFRQSWRWWLQLPWLRARSAWRRLGGAWRE